jgi:hypothetical protein
MRYVPAVLLLSCSFTAIALGQNTPEPKRMQGVQYYKVEYHRFKPGKAEEGRQFIRKHFRPADRAAGIEVLEFTPLTGDWDWIAFFLVEADFLAWERSPMSLRARAKLEEMVGGAEKTRILDEEFNNLIQELRVEIMVRDLEK